MTVTFKRDLDTVKINENAKYPSETVIYFKRYGLDTHTPY